MTVGRSQGHVDSRSDRETRKEIDKFLSVNDCPSCFDGQGGIPLSTRYASLELSISSTHGL